MTKIRYFEDGDEIAIEIKGHAGYDKVGSDIVCSAISILGQTLLACLEVDHDKFQYVMKDGMIWAYGKGKDVRHTLAVIMTGYWLIKENYPDYLSIDRGCGIQDVVSIDIT